MTTSPPIEVTSPAQELRYHLEREGALGRGILGAGVLGGIATTSGVALTATSGWLIVRASEQPVILTLLTAIVAVRAFGMARPVFRYAERLASHDAALATLAARRWAAYDRLIPLTPAGLGRRRRADVLTGVVHDLEDEVNAQVRVTVPVIASTLTGIAAIALTVWVAPAVGLVVAGLALVVAVLSRWGLVRETRLLPETLAARAEVGRVAELMASQAHELQAVGGWPRAQEWLATAHADLARATRRLTVGRAVVAGGFVATTGAAVLVTATIVSDLPLGGPVKALLLLTPVALADAITPLGDAVRALAQARGAAARTRALLSGPSGPVGAEPGPGASSGSLTRRGKAAFASLELIGLEASWPGASATGATGARATGAGATGAGASGASRASVGPVDLMLRAGESVAITGTNGSGKSTLLAVIARHLALDAGAYLWDGHDVTMEVAEDIRSRIAFVDDDPHVFATSLRHNLLLARPDATDTDIGRALTRAGLGRLVEDLPDGLDTRLGAGGRGLSGGERARLAIARALLSERPVILLDEPVAHLDPPTASAVLRDLLDPAPGEGLAASVAEPQPTMPRPAIVLVSHRHEGLDLVDRVIHLGPARQ